MFSGIVGGTATVESVENHKEWLQLRIHLLSEQRLNLVIGASVSVNGTCLTVTNIEGNSVRFDVIAESLARTSFPQIQVGDLVNIERALQPGEENGGHNVSGHIDGTAAITEVSISQGNHVLRFKPQAHLRPYIFNKGFLAVHGISLTCGNVDRTTGEFTVWLIPETLRRTNLGTMQVGDLVNIEVNRETQERVDTVLEHLQLLLKSNEFDSEKIAAFKQELLGSSE